MVKRVPIAVAERARRLLRMTDELESVSDETATILKVTRRLRKESQWFSPSSQELLLGVHDRVAAFAACGRMRLTICLRIGYTVFVASGGFCFFIIL